MGHMTSPNKGRSKISVKSVDRAFAILEYLSNHGSAGISELSRRLDIPKSSLHYLVETIRARGYIEKDDHDRYSLRLKLFHLASKPLERYDIIQQAAYTMDKIAKETGETCKLAVREGTEAVVIYKIDAPQSLRVVSRIGAKEQLHCTAIGKALIAWLPEDEIRAMFGAHELERFTPNTITNVEDLLLELKRVRQMGIAFDDKESDIHAHCVAAPIRDHTGLVVAAISVSGPTERLPRAQLAKFGEIVGRGAEDISQRLGSRSVM